MVWSGGGGAGGVGYAELEAWNCRLAYLGCKEVFTTPSLGVRGVI